MAFALTVRIEGTQDLRRMLAKLDPQQNAEIFIRSAREIATKIAANLSRSIRNTCSRARRAGLQLEWAISFLFH